MANVYWIGTTGSLAWSVAANWSTGSVPATGDNVTINQGSADINSGLAQSAVALASLTVTSGFTGTIGVDGDNQPFLQVSPGTLLCPEAPSAGGFQSGGFTLFKLDVGTSTYTGVISSTGQSQDTGRGALQIQGGSSSSSLYVTGGSVDVATIPGATATLNLLEISGGTVTTGPGLTCPTVNQTNGSTASALGPQAVSQSSGGSTLIFGGACTTLNQTAGTLYTLGAGLVGTLKVGGSAVLGNRPASGNAFTNLTVDAAGSVDFTGDPRSLLIANAPTLYKGATFSTWNKTQVLLAGPASLQLSLVDCGPSDVVLSVGAGITLTVA